MKKNKMLRIASILLVVTLLSTCVISGTFAKYVTKASGTDQARVAKWGVVLDLTAGGAFATEYAPSDGSDYTGEFSVKSSNTENVVAPGTSAEEIGAAITGHIMGTPEVATRYSVEITNIQDILLPAGDNYTDYTELVKNDTDGTYGYTNTFNLSKDYTPLVWTIKFGSITLATDNSLTTALGKVDQLRNKLAALSDSGAITNVQVDTDGATYLKFSFDAAPNTPLNDEFSLTWQWKFNGNDKADTYLGNVAAGVITDANAKVVVSADVAISATQLD